jgi:hypothetical protein
MQFLQACLLLAFFSLPYATLTYGPKNDLPVKNLEAHHQKRASAVFTGIS